MRGERYTLLRNNGSKWDVKDPAGHKVTAPAVCFMIPPTDPESVAMSDKWVNTDKSLASSCCPVLCTHMYSNNIFTTSIPNMFNVCYVCPCSLMTQQTALKQKMTANMGNLQKHFEQLKKESGTGVSPIDFYWLIKTRPQTAQSGIFRNVKWWRFWGFFLRLLNLQFRE